MSSETRHLRALMRLPLLIVGFAVAVGAPASAPGGSYAYSENDITLKVTGGTSSDPKSSLSSNEATFEGFGTDKPTNPLDAREAESGPGPFPGENSFGAQGKVGEYARSDSQITGTDIDNIMGSNVAEAYRTSPGFAFAEAICFVSFRLTQTGDGPINLVLTGHPVMTASADNPGELATASIAVAVSFKDPTTQKTLFTWMPNGTTNDFTITSGVVTNVVDPYNLNKSITAVGGPDMKGYAPGPNTFKISYRGSPGQTFDAKVLWFEVVTVSVPEPSSIVMLGLGVAIVCLARRFARPNRRPGPVAQLSNRHFSRQERAGVHELA